MAKYLLQANLSSDGVKGVLKEGGTARRVVVEKAVQSVGGTLEAFYFSFGTTDVWVIADVPDNVSMAALALTISSSGTVSAKTTVLITPEELDEAAKKTVSFRPPGQ